LYATVARRLADGTAFFPEQCLSIDEAIRSYTLNGAHAAFEESRKGSLSVGKLADMIVIDRDLRNIPLEQIPQTQVMTTIIGGRIVYQK
jgi:predicted amidohydrolase YtcJ